MPEDTEEQKKFYCSSNSISTKVKEVVDKARNWNLSDLEKRDAE